MSTTLKFRLPIIGLAALCLLAGLWAGLVRLGWALPSLPISSTFIVQHGGLMLSSFLGSVITLERAVALNQRWTYAAAAAAGLGGATMLVGAPDSLSIGLMCLGSVGLSVMFGMILRQKSSLPYIVMAIGALLWVVGNGLWWIGLPVYRAAPWWISFLVLTVLGERLELGRVFSQHNRYLKVVLGAAGLVIVGLVIGLFTFETGIRLSGIGLLGIGVWLLRFDVARRTIRSKGLPRFMAACLLPGYLWLVIGGALWIGLAPLFVAGFAYDAMVHGILVGFIFSMIFGHAPIIVPIITGIMVAEVKPLYLPLVLLHVGLVLRIVGDLATMMVLRQWGGLLNEVAVLLFLVLLVYRVVASRAAARSINPA